MAPPRPYLSSVSDPALPRHDPRQEPGAVVPHAGICTGGSVRGARGDPGSYRVKELAVARADGSYTKQLARLAKIRVLVLDDFLLAPLKDPERRDLLEILEDRYDRSSTVITSQLPTDKWHAALSDPTVADAICDRVVHNAHVLTLDGPSGRKTKGLTTKEKP